MWWLNGSSPDCCPAVPVSNPASPQPTADRPSNYENTKKHIKKKINKIIF
jgi:hypothetical protein